MCIAYTASDVISIIAAFTASFAFSYTIYKLWRLSR